MILKSTEVYQCMYVHNELFARLTSDKNFVINFTKYCKVSFLNVKVILFFSLFRIMLVFISFKQNVDIAMPGDFNENPNPMYFIIFNTKANIYINKISNSELSFLTKSLKIEIKFVEHRRRKVKTFVTYNFLQTFYYHFIASKACKIQF